MSFHLTNGTSNQKSQPLTHVIYAKTIVAAQAPARGGYYAHNVYRVGTIRETYWDRERMVCHVRACSDS